MTVRQCAAAFRPGLDQLFSDLEAGRNFLAAQQLFRLLENLVHRPLFHGWQFTVRARSGHHNSFLTELGISLDSRRTSRTRDGSGSWRRESDSNRHRRLCRPLHDPSAIPPCLQEREGSFSTSGLPFGILERETSLELATSTLARLRSTN